MRKCEICGKWFEEKTETAKYCGYACRRARRRELSAKYRKQRADKRGENMRKAIETDEKNNQCATAGSIYFLMQKSRFNLWTDADVRSAWES